jgi:hypothetical protein
MTVTTRPLRLLLTALRASVYFNGAPTTVVGHVEADGTVSVTDTVVGARPFEDFAATIDKLLSAGR